ncbi:hypothetical protein MC885_004719 [Smutsia gigantea]|nr:hypothetical protein MC885_004719 [Smutsia gigantea]
MQQWGSTTEVKPQELRSGGPGAGRSQTLDREPDIFHYPEGRADFLQGAWEPARSPMSMMMMAMKYAGKDGNNSKLSKTKFLTFMNTELAAFTKNKKDPGVLDCMMKKLDLNCDGQLDFQEFFNLIGGMAIACHDSFMMSAHFQKCSSNYPTWRVVHLYLTVQTTDPDSLPWEPCSQVTFKCFPGKRRRRQEAAPVAGRHGLSPDAARPLRIPRHSRGSFAAAGPARPGHGFSDPGHASFDDPWAACPPGLGFPSVLEGSDEPALGAGGSSAVRAVGDPEAPALGAPHSPGWCFSAITDTR